MRRDTSLFMRLTKQPDKHVSAETLPLVRLVMVQVIRTSGSSTMLTKS